MKILSFGSGYVGLVTAACLAKEGHQVITIVEDHDSLEEVRNGKLKVEEKGLKDLLNEVVASRNLELLKDESNRTFHADVLIMAPSCEAPTGLHDLQYAKEVLEDLSPRVEGVELLVCRSTLPPGSAQQLQQIFNRDRLQYAEVATFPEFMSEGIAIQQLAEMEFCILGSSSSKSQQILTTLLGNLLPENTQWVSPSGAELIKYATNGFFAMKMSYTNELARLADQLEVPIDEVTSSLGLNKRIGPLFLQAGPGYGGIALPKNVASLADLAEEAGLENSLFATANAINSSQPNYLLSKLKDSFPQGLKDSRISIWGMAYKPGSTDLNHSPSMGLVKELLKQGAQVIIHDPALHSALRSLLGDQVYYAEVLSASVLEIDALIVMNLPEVAVNWKEVLKAMKGKTILDCRNQLDSDQLQSLGFEYLGTGL